MSERLENLFELVTAGEWGSNQGTAGGMDTGVIRSANFTKDHKFNSKEIVIRSIEERKRQRKLLCHGDILIEKSGGSPDQPVGRVLYYDLEGEHTCSNFISILRPSRQADPKFLYYSLCNLYERGVVKNYQQQTTGIINLQLGEYLQESIFFPPLSEQKKIAEILSGIDREIAGVSQFMKRKRLLRESLLRQMIPHPSSFRDGSLPKGWTLTTIEEVCSLITYGFTNPMPTTERGVYMVTAKDVRDGKIDKTTARFTSVEAYETLLTDKSRPKQNDILVTKDGTLGRTAVVGEETICINQSVALLRPSDQQNAQFLQLLLSSPQYQETMLEESGGSAVKHIYITTLAKMQMAIPNSTEAREEVVDCFDALNRSIHLLARKHECLTNLKKALASDLLSGRKRVSV